MWQRVKALFSATSPPRPAHPAELDAALHLLAPRWAERGQPSSWRNAYWNDDRRYVAVLGDDHVTYVVDLHSQRCLEFASGSARGLQGTVLTLELSTRFDAYPAFTDIEDVDLSDPSLTWQPCCKDEGLP